MGGKLFSRRSWLERRVLAVGARQRAPDDVHCQQHGGGRASRPGFGARVHQPGPGLAPARARCIGRAQGELIGVGVGVEPYRSSGPVRGTSLGAEDHTTYLLSVPVLDTEGSETRAGASAARADASGARAGVSRAVSKGGGEPPPSRPSPAPAAVPLFGPVPGPGPDPWLAPAPLAVFSPPSRRPRPRRRRLRPPRSLPERSPPERSPPDRSPPERSPPERSPPERSPPPG